jgi:hypothetical protein
MEESRQFNRHFKLEAAKLVEERGHQHTKQRQVRTRKRKGCATEPLPCMVSHLAQLSKTNPPHPED